MGDVILDGEQWFDPGVIINALHTNSKVVLINMPQPVNQVKTRMIVHKSNAMLRLDVMGQSEEQITSTLPINSGSTNNALISLVAGNIVGLKFLPNELNEITQMRNINIKMGDTGWSIHGGTNTHFSVTCKNAHVTPGDAVTQTMANISFTVREALTPVSLMIWVITNNYTPPPDSNLLHPWRISSGNSQWPRTTMRSSRARGYGRDSSDQSETSLTKKRVSPLQASTKSRMVRMPSSRRTTQWEKYWEQQGVSSDGLPLPGLATKTD